MTKLFSLFLAALFVLVAAGCSDSSTNNTNGELTMGTMKCKVDGASWQSMNAMAVKAGAAAISISGATTNIQTGETTTISFTISGEIVEGTGNTISIGQYAVMNINNPQQQTLYNAVNPSINITKVNSEEIQGKFSFKGETNAGQSKNITDGEFRVKFVN